MKEQYIDSPDLFLYKRFQELYKVSFPLFEQRSEQQQMQAFRNDKYRLLAFTENEAFVGFISYWEFDTYLYVEHLAIDTEVRAQGIWQPDARPVYPVAGKDRIVGNRSGCR